MDKIHSQSIQDARRALREHIGCVLKLRRYSGPRNSAGKKTTVIVVDNHKKEFGLQDLHGERWTFPNPQIWRRCMKINLQVLRTS
jgi:hypothetical protein